MKFKGNRLEHDKMDVENCDCPVCELNNDYFARLDAYNAKKQYLVFTSAGPRDSDHDEKKLNEMHDAGYDLILGMNGIIYMKAMPPEAPTQAQVINEIVRRQALADNPKEEDFDIDDLVVAPGSKTLN